MYRQTGMGPEDLISALISSSNGLVGHGLSSQKELTNSPYGLGRTAPHCQYNKYEAYNKHRDRQQHAHG
ncbi:hypothetical protein ACVWZ6_008598 [Bradyrhizobium sp. GM6.1]